MTFYALCFYLVSAVILTATALAITRPHPVHAVVYLILSFLGSAMLFYLLGAPFLAALEVIIYAGAIMVLFLFVIMMLKAEVIIEARLTWRKWLPAVFLGLIYFVLAWLLVFLGSPEPYPSKDGCGHAPGPGPLRLREVLAFRGDDLPSSAHRSGGRYSTGKG